MTTTKETCPENCNRCSGEFCEQHGPNPCRCDVIERHKIITKETCPRKQEGRRCYKCRVLLWKVREVHTVHHGVWCDDCWENRNNHGWQLRDRYEF
jgi:hypothetical protein